MRFVEQDLADVMVMARETTVPAASAEQHEDGESRRPSDRTGLGRCSVDPKRDTDRYRLVVPLMPASEDD